ncbi:hypothetical protein N007_13050 [Alicyclobacillus acidoterrestris ATCC 49025]|nr:hypothetical protein N007_13050 [Alicyclobacillus acidoterrestris ATCC 49025]
MAKIMESKLVTDIADYFSDEIYIVTVRDKKVTKKDRLCKSR